MNTQMERHNDQDHPALGLRPPGGDHGHNEEMVQDGEKKSVLKKVKAKAKKIKDAVTGHHHNHDHHDHSHDDDDDDEEVETDPEVHDALPSEPRSVAPALPGAQLSSQLPTSQPAHFETFDPTSTNYIPIQEEPFGHSEIDTGRSGGDYQTFDPSTVRYVPGQEETLSHSRTDTRGPIVSEERPYAPSSTPAQGHALKNGVAEDLGRALERSLDLEEDPHAAKDGGVLPENYQMKVSDPTGRGAEEIGVTPILHRLDRMHIHEEPPQEQPSTGQDESLFKPSLPQEKTTTPIKPPAEQTPSLTGTHDQFSPEPLTRETTQLVSPEPPAEQKPLLTETHDQFSPEPLTPETTQLVSPEPPAEQKPLLTGTHDQFSPEPLTPETTQLVSPKPGDKASETSYTEMVPSALTDKAKQATTILQNVASKVGSTVASTVQSSTPSGGTEPELEVAVDKGVSMKEYIIEKLKPGEEDRALSELITENLPLHKKTEGANEMGSEKGVMDRIKDAASSLFGKGQTPSEGYSDNSTTGY